MKTLIFATATSLCPLGISAETGQISLGPGSYTTIRPESCKPLPTKKFRSAELTGATPTNQWWSSLVWEKYSHPLFAHPLVLQCLPRGLSVSYPGDHITGKGGHITGGTLHPGGDFTITHTHAETFPEARLRDFSDCFITAEFKSDTAEMQLSFGHGSPFVFCQFKGGSALLQFTKKPIIWQGALSQNTLGITIHGRHYGIFGASGSHWELTGNHQLKNQKAKAYCSVAILPDARPETLAFFEKSAHQHVIKTTISSRVVGDRIHTNYHFQTQPKEGPAETTILALYPHHWKYTTQTDFPYRYQSVRGLMKVKPANEFQTIIPIQGLLPVLPQEGILDQKRMISYLKAEPKTTEFKDSYWEGKHLGKLASLSGIAEIIDADALHQRFLEEIKFRLESWFTATPGTDSPLFYFDKNWQTLIGSKPSYGSDWQLNDHHFHYGYFIRAAAEVARHDRKWAKKWAPMVELLIREIASPNRNDPLFPHLRCFDAYAGHSWASGQALYADGNNQESSSESLNAWYAIMLWGAATDQPKLRDLGTMLYNIERTAAEEYWFDVSGTNFPEDYPHETLGMVWGGKGSFSTWFSEETDHIHGINWLPFTPASVSLGRHPEYLDRNYQQLMQSRGGKKDFNTGWGDLVVMFYAQHSPAPMAAYLDQNPQCRIEAGNSHAFMYHWLNTFTLLGLIQPKVTSSHPFTNVYLKNGKRSYAAYNHGPEAREIQFSDGYTMTAKSRQLTLAR